MGFALGLPVDAIVPSITKGLGGTLGGLAIVVSFGAMLGKLMADSGGSTKNCHYIDFYVRGKKCSLGCLLNRFCRRYCTFFMKSALYF